MSRRHGYACGIPSARPAPPTDGGTRDDRHDQPDPGRARGVGRRAPAPLQRRVVLRPVGRGGLGRPARPVLPRRESRVVDALRDGVLGRAERGPAGGAHPAGVGLGRLHRHLVRADPPADDAAGDLRDGPVVTGVPVGAHRDRRRVPALDHVRPRDGEAERARLPAEPQGDGAGAVLQDGRLGGGRLRRHPGGRGGPRRHAARLDARRAGRALRAHDQQHPRGRGVAAHEVRPRRGDPEDGHDRPGPPPRERAARGVVRLPHRHQHGQPARLRRGRSGRRPRQAGSGRERALQVDAAVQLPRPHGVPAHRPACSRSPPSPSTSGPTCCDLRHHAELLQGRHLRHRLPGQLHLAGARHGRLRRAADALHRSEGVHRLRRLRRRVPGQRRRPGGLARPRPSWSTRT